jgi:hypothetical protein
MQDSRAVALAQGQSRSRQARACDTFRWLIAEMASVVPTPVAAVRDQELMQRRLPKVGSLSGRNRSQDVLPRDALEPIDDVRRRH